MINLRCEAIARAALGEPLKRAGSELYWRCPWHDDEHASLQANQKKNCWMCGPCGISGNAWELAARFAGVSPDDKPSVTAWLRERDLLNGASGNPSPPSAGSFHQVAEYSYSPDLRKVRRERPAANGGKPEKTFRWEHRKGEAWLPGAGGLPKPLYANQLFRESDQLGVVLAVEGESKADLAGEWDYPAFSFKSLTAAQCDVLAGLDVVLWRDKDPSGLKQSDDAAKVMHDSKQPRRIRMITLPAELPEKGDIVDAVHTLGWGRAEIENLIQAAPEWKQAAASVASEGSVDRAEPQGWRDVFHAFENFEKAAPLSFAIKGFLQNNGATLIGGLSGHGKTLCMLSIVKALLAGKGTALWNHFEVMETAVRVLYLIPEATIEAFKYRLKLFGLYHYLAPDDDRLLVRTLSKGPTPSLSDPRILYAAKGAHVFLDTAVRFSTEGDENSAGDNQRGLAADIFGLLGAGARTVSGAHHSPKPFARENVMRLENVLRGSGDIGAMVSTAWGIKQIDAAQNIVHIENIKPRDFQPCEPFQLIGRPFIDSKGDFQMHKKPGECGSLQDEQQPERERGGGAPLVVREAKAANLALLRTWLTENQNLTSSELVRKFSDNGIKVDGSSIRRYRKELSR